MEAAGRGCINTEDLDKTGAEPLLFFHSFVCQKKFYLYQTYLSFAGESGIKNCNTRKTQTVPEGYYPVVEGMI